MHTIEQVERHQSTDDATFHAIIAAAIIAASSVDWEAAYAEQDTAELAGDAVRDMLIDLAPEPLKQLVSIGLEDVDWEEVFEVLFEIQEMESE